MDMASKAPSTTSTSTGPQIRSRITVVCAECKRLKLKCDRRTPCGSCTKRDTVVRCIYSPAAAEKVDLHSLNNRLIHVEGILAQITAGQFTSSYPLSHAHHHHPCAQLTTTSSPPFSLSLNDISSIFLSALDPALAPTASSPTVKLEPSPVHLINPHPQPPSPPSSATAHGRPHPRHIHTHLPQPTIYYPAPANGPALSPALIALLSPAWDALPSTCHPLIPGISTRPFWARLARLLTPTSAHEQRARAIIFGAAPSVDSPNQESLFFFAAACAALALALAHHQDEHKGQVPPEVDIHCDPEFLHALSVQALGVGGAWPCASVGDREPKRARVLAPQQYSDNEQDQAADDVDDEDAEDGERGHHSGHNYAEADVGEVENRDRLYALLAQAAYAAFACTGGARVGPLAGTLLNTARSLGYPYPSSSRDVNGQADSNVSRPGQRNRQQQRAHLEKERKEIWNGVLWYDLLAAETMGAAPLVSSATVDETDDDAEVDRQLRHQYHEPHRHHQNSDVHLREEAAKDGGGGQGCCQARSDEDREELRLLTRLTSLTHFVTRTIEGARHSHSNTSFSTSNGFSAYTHNYNTHPANADPVRPTAPCCCGYTLDTAEMLERRVHGFLGACAVARGKRDGMVGTNPDDDDDCSDGVDRGRKGREDIHGAAGSIHPETDANVKRDGRMAIIDTRTGGDGRIADLEVLGWRLLVRVWVPFLRGSDAGGVSGISNGNSHTRHHNNSSTGTTRTWNLVAQRAVVGAARGALSVLREIFEPGSIGSSTGSPRMGSRTPPTAQDDLAIINGYTKVGVGRVSSSLGPWMDRERARSLSDALVICVSTGEGAGGGGDVGWGVGVLGDISADVAYTSGTGGRAGSGEAILRAEVVGALRRRMEGRGSVKRKWSEVEGAPGASNGSALVGERGPMGDAYLHTGEAAVDSLANRRESTFDSTDSPQPAQTSPLQLPHQQQPQQNSQERPSHSPYHPQSNFGPGQQQHAPGAPPPQRKSSLPTLTSSLPHLLGKDKKHLGHGGKKQGTYPSVGIRVRGKGVNGSANGHGAGGVVDEEDRTQQQMQMQMVREAYRSRSSSFNVQDHSQTQEQPQPDYGGGYDGHVPRRRYSTQEMSPLGMGNSHPPPLAPPALVSALPQHPNHIQSHQKSIFPTSTSMSLSLAGTTSTYDASRAGSYDHSPPRRSFDHGVVPSPTSYTPISAAPPVSASSAPSAQPTPTVGPSHAARAPGSAPLGSPYGHPADLGSYPATSPYPAGASSPYTSTSSGEAIVSYSHSVLSDGNAGAGTGTNGNINGGPSGLASPGSGPFASSPVGYFLGGYDGMQGMVVGMDTALDRLGDVPGTGGTQQIGGGASGGQGESTPGTPRYEIENTFEVKPRIMELHSGYENVGMEQHQQWPPHQRPSPLQIQHGGHQNGHQQQHEHEQQQYWGSAAATGFYQ